MHGWRKVVSYLSMPLCIFCCLLSCDSRPYVRSVGYVFAYLYILDDDLECSMDYDTSLLPEAFPWCGLEAYWRGVTVINYFWWKLEKNIYKSVCMEGKDHIFTFDFIVCWVNVPCQGVLHSVNTIFYHPSVF